MESSNPVQILAGVLACFYGGFRLRLKDRVSGQRELDCALGEMTVEPAGGPSLAAIRKKILEDGSSGSIELETSGTTGQPRVVGHNWESLFRGIRQGEDYEGAVWGLCFNPSHIAGIQVLLQAFVNDCDLVDLFNAAPWQRGEILRSAGVTHLSATPSWFRVLLADLAGEDPFPGVRVLTFGGECLGKGLMDLSGRIFPEAKLRNIYASTEFGTLLVSDGEIFSVPERLMDQVMVREGRLFVSTWLLGEGDEAEGDWYDSGDCVDVVSISPLRFRFVGRDSEQVTVGGYQVNLSEVEKRLRQHPLVREARVLARGNSVTGSLLTAEVVPEAGAVSEPELRAYMEKHFPSHAVPRMITSVDNLSLSRTGKLQR